ncbi:MAG: ribosomal L7Ae/L30e/S12e/Gadd45 family protein [Oscillospiraceae bacterium]|nr:ribosomal L7Ae/L30e/S12e/Gadd45 family protein [Oscillospiraceae bacterium]
MSTLCLCRRASKLVIGFDASVEEIKKKTVGGVVLASDVSPKTEKEVLFFAQQSNIEVIKAGFMMDEAKSAIGKRAGVFFVSDEGLFGSVRKHITI